MAERRNGGDNIKGEKKRIKALEKERERHLNDYKMGIRKAYEIIANIREIDAEIKRLKEKRV